MNTKSSRSDPTLQFSLFDTTVPLRNESAAQDLPATARELVDLVGIDATINLVKDFAGDDLKIPEVINGTSRMWAILVETIGPDAAAKLVKRYAGMPIYVPTCHLALLGQRDRQIVQAFDAGEPFDKVRRDFKLTCRNLYRILKKPL